MRLIIDSTDEIGTFTINGTEVPARIWFSTTPAGNRAVLFVTRIMVDEAAAAELAAALNDVTADTIGVMENNRPPRTAPPDAPQGEWETVTEPGVDMDALVEGLRVEKLFTWYRLVIDRQMVWIEPRPSYCDRGRYHANYTGSFHIDAADGFPRYYMDLEVAKREMKSWLLHRMECQRRQG